MKELSLIVAMTKNGVIGKDNKIPWHIPQDLKLFKELTTGNVVIMGRKTYESIGRPLPNRENIVISNSVKEIEGCLVFDSVLKAVRHAQTLDKGIFFIGGSELYRLVLDIVTHLYISWVKADYCGDTYFPEVCFSEWKMEEVLDFEEFTMMHYSRNIQEARCRA
ncbi:MAG: dihydrofolate reductase [Deferribacterales bacterium]